MRRWLKHLTGHRRTVTSNRTLGWLLAFNAGAINAGGFLVVHQYTSHVTGFVSQMADYLVLGEATMALGAVGVILAFMTGAAVTAMMVHWARHRRLHSVYALPLLVEAVLLLLFGLMGAVTLRWQTPFAVPMTVLLLSFIMGLQNAVVTKMSSSSIRTTHMTGVVTDLGMELGKLAYWNRGSTLPEHRVHANYQRLRLFAGLLGMFLCGGVLGAWGFQQVGFISVVPLAVMLLALALPPLWWDRHALRRMAPWKPPRHPV